MCSSDLILERVGILKINRFYWSQWKPWLPLTSSLAFLNNLTIGDKMNREEKITAIIKMFNENIADLKKIIKRTEHQSILFCLSIGDKIVGVDIQKSFIDNRTFAEIESHFSKRHIYHSILTDHDPKMCDHDGIFTYINDPSCRDMLSF